MRLVTSTATIAGIRLMGPGPRKIAVITTIRSHLELGLKEAKALVDASEHSPQLIALPADSSSTLAKFASDLESAGAMIQRS